MSKNRQHVASSLSADDLSPAPEITDAWPQAVHPNLIMVGNDTEKRFRALQIAAIVKRNEIDYEGKRVLDVGCGEGHLVAELARQAEDVLGYDIIRDKSWDSKVLATREQHFSCAFTSDPKTVETQGPFDVIVLFDVLDHAIKVEPSELLAWCADLLTEDGVIFVRFHPWTSRDGGHLYDQLNKAYVHLVFTTDELALMGVVVAEPGAKANQRIIRPLATYNTWISKANLAIKRKTAKTSEVEPFFEKLLPRINEVSWAGTCGFETITKIMQTSSIDLVLGKNSL